MSESNRIETALTGGRKSPGPCRVRTGVACVLAFALLLGCQPKRAPSLLFLVSDAFRADAMRCEGEPPLTPNLCAMAREGVRFRNAYAAGPWTLPSSVTLFTGRHSSVFERDAMRNRSFYYVPRQDRLLSRLLAEAGYLAALQVENGVALRGKALDWYFGDESEAFRRPATAAERARIEALLGREGLDDRVLPLLRLLIDPPDQPLFAVQWFFDPHVPYDPPEAVVASLAARQGAYPREIDWYTRLVTKKTTADGAFSFKKQLGTMTPAELGLMEELYRLDAASVDDRVGAILDALERSGRKDETVVVFTSDHGEGFGEHGEWTHAGDRLYNEFIRIPMLLSGPGIPRGRDVSSAVSHVDLVPTLCELLSLKCPADLPGRSLVELFAGKEPPRDRDTLVVTRNHRVLVRNGHKLIVRPWQVELYDLAADPDERMDLSAQRPELVAELRAAIDSLDAADRPTRDRVRALMLQADDLQQVRDETLEELRAIGYVE